MYILENSGLKVMKRIMKSKLLSKKDISSRTQMRMNEVLLNQCFLSQHQIRKLTTRNDELDEQVSKLWQILDSSNKCSHKNNPTKIDSSLQNSDLIQESKKIKNNILSNNYKKQINHQKDEESLRDFRKKKANFKVNQQEKQNKGNFENERIEQQLDLKKVESEQDQNLNSINQSQGLFFDAGDENNKTKKQQIVDTVYYSQIINIEQNDIQHSWLNSQGKNFLIMNKKSKKYEPVIDKSIKQKSRHYQFYAESKYERQIQSQKQQRELPVSIQLMLDTTSQSDIYQKNDNFQFKQIYRSLISLQEFHKLESKYSWFRKSQSSLDPIFFIDFNQKQSIKNGKIIESFKEFIQQSKNIKDQYQKLNAQVKSITFTSFNHLQLMKECLIQNKWLNYQHIIIKQNNIQQNWQNYIDFNEFFKTILKQFRSQKTTFQIHLNLLFPQYLQAIKQIEIQNHLFIHIKHMTKQTYNILLQEQFKSLQFINIIYNDQCLQSIKQFNILDIQQITQKKEVQVLFLQDQKYLVCLQMQQYVRKVQKIKDQIKQLNQQIYEIQKDGKFIYKIKNDQLFDLLIQQQSWQEVKQIWFEKVITFSQWGKFVQKAISLKNLESIFFMKQNEKEFFYNFVKSKDVLKFQKLSKIVFSIHEQFQLRKKKMDKQFQFFRIEIISELKHLHIISSQCSSGNRLLEFSVLNVQLFQNQYPIKWQITVGKNLTEDIRRFAYFDGEQYSEQELIQKYQEQVNQFISNRQQQNKKIKQMNQKDKFLLNSFMMIANPVLSFIKVVKQIN